MEALSNFITNERVKKAAFWFGVALIVISLLGMVIYFMLRPAPGRTNILVLGAAGGEHIAGDLTDTIIFLSIDHQTGKTLVLALPRDIWIPALRTKLNSVYHYQGMDGTKKVVEEILGQPVHYGLLINFDVFTQIIDTLGGVEVDVERSFDDYKYPIPGKENDPCDGDPEYKCRYEHIHFEAGLQRMDGEQALKYVRSRFAEGEEGTDFARSKRQQRLLFAIKNKVLSPRTLLRLGIPLSAKVGSTAGGQLIKVVLSNIETDISQERYDDLIKLVLKFRSENLQMEVLDEDRLIAPPPSKIKYDEQWVLIPRTGNWEEIQEYVATLLR